MAYNTWVWMLLVIFSTGLMGSIEAYEFKAGGKQGWVLNPSENYNQWSQKMRFQVNDTIFFKYNKGTDSVLLVNKQDYDTCSTQNPIMKMDGGDSVFKFDRSGPFYFISGNKDNCDKGQKLIVVVLAVRNSKMTPSQASPPASSPANTPSSPTPAKSPATAPSPAGKIPATSPAPGSSTESPSPAKSPATSPEPAGTTLSPGVTPGDTAGTSLEPSPSPPPRSSAPAFSTHPVFMVLLVTVMSGLAG